MILTESEPYVPRIVAQAAALRRQGMSHTAVRRALGLSPRQALEWGLEAPLAATPSTAQDTPSTPTPQAQARHYGPSMASVVAAVCVVSGLTEAELKGPAQTSRISRMRWLTCYLINEFCAVATYENTAKTLKIHLSSVRDGRKRAEALLADDADFRRMHTEVVLVAKGAEV